MHYFLCAQFSLRGAMYLSKHMDNFFYHKCYANYGLEKRIILKMNYLYLTSSLSLLPFDVSILYRK